MGIIIIVPCAVLNNCGHKLFFCLARRKGQVNEAPAGDAGRPAAIAQQNAREGREAARRRVKGARV